MTDVTTDNDRVQARQLGEAPQVVYDRRSLTYANSFDAPLRAFVIRLMEWMTGKATIVRRVRRFERMGAPKGQAFWPAGCIIVVALGYLAATGATDDIAQAVLGATSNSVSAPQPQN